MRVAVIDDERPARSELIHLIRSCGESDGLEIDILEASSGKSALEILAEAEADLIFLDIHLGDMEGTTLAAILKKTHPDAEVVFATAYNDYAEKAFDVKAFNYILKPFEEKRVFQTIREFVKVKEARKKSALPVTKLSIYNDKRLIVVDIQDIVYIEVVNRHCIVHTVNGDCMSSSTISAYEEKLKDCGFFRIQKGYLINLKYVIEIYPWVSNTSCVRLQGFEKEILTVGRNQLKALKELFDI